MILPEGDLRYEIRRGGTIIAIEDSSFDGHRVAGERRFADSTNRYEASAELAEDAKYCADNAQLLARDLSTAPPATKRSEIFCADRLGATR